MYKIYISNILYIGKETREIITIRVDYFIKKHNISKNYYLRENNESNRKNENIQ